ncbi:MAG: hypothetical protein DHS20C08_16450 [Rhodomicrobium sp.]|nr:MAG: hypothetical protein DHS20C08_16450 [Rhodomicrobium sp.]
MDGAGIIAARLSLGNFAIFAIWHPHGTSSGKGAFLGEGATEWAGAFAPHHAASGHRLFITHPVW